MARELASFIRYTLSVSLFTGRLNAYAQKMEFLPTAITDFENRNGYFYRYAKMAGTRVNAAGIKVEVPDTTPIHLRLPDVGTGERHHFAVATRFCVTWHHPTSLPSSVLNVYLYAHRIRPKRKAIT